MKSRAESGMRSYIEDSLSRGYSLRQIEKALIENGYPLKRAKAIITDYRNSRNNSPKKTKAITTDRRDSSHRHLKLSNNFLAAVLLFFITASVLSNYLILCSIPKSPAAMESEFTGMSFATGTTTLCVNSQPQLDISACADSANVSEEYYCIATTSDTDTGTVLTYYDNTSLFNITLLTGIINFTPSLSDTGTYDINITVHDGSTCPNEWDTETLCLDITKTCDVKSPPVFNNLSTNYTIHRNRGWSLLINATDPDPEDGITYTVTELNYSSYSAFGSTLNYNSTSGLLNITASITQIGSHWLNISAKDNSSCPDDTIWKLVEIMVDPANTAPVYIGGASDLDYSWNEDTTIYNVYNLDDYFNDTDGDCLKYEMGYVSGSSILQVIISNNIDPRGRACPASHFVTLRPVANQFGESIVCYNANDTINVSKQVCVKYTIVDVPEPVVLPPGAVTTAPLGGGGGAFAGVPAAKRCEEKWYCTRWGECTDGFMSRNCTDINKCGTSKFMPNSTKSCVDIDHCKDGIQNHGEEGIDCGGPCSAECSTCYDSIMNCHLMEDGRELCEEGVDCGGPCRPCTEEERVEIEELPSPVKEYRVEYSPWLWLLLLLLLLLIYYIIRKLKKRKKKSEQARPKAAERSSKIRSILSTLASSMTMWRKKERRAPKKSSHKTAMKLARIYGSIGKKADSSIIADLTSAIREWLRKEFGISPGTTIEELSKGIRDSRTVSRIENNIRPFLSMLADIAYSGASISHDQLGALVVRAAKIMNVRSPQQLAEKEEKRDKARKQQDSGVKIIPIVLITIAVLTTMFFIFRPQITGLLVGAERAPIRLSINKEFMDYSIHDLGIGKGFGSLKLDGRVSGDSDIRVYVGSMDDNYLVFNSSALAQDKGIKRDAIKTDHVKTFTDRKDIDLRLDYNTATPWDSDDDGFAALDEAVDITVKDTRFSWSVDESKLCTLWKVSSERSADYTCYGSYECCSLLELTPERDGWDDTFYLTYEKYGATDYNIVSAKVIYADYSLDPELAHSEIIESETEDISAAFEADMIYFSDICIESCLIGDSIEDSLYIEVSSGKIYIESAVYTPARDRLTDKAPQFSVIPNITIEKGSRYVLDLNEYVSDPEDDLLHFGFFRIDNIDIRITDGIAEIMPEEGFEGRTYTFFTANDSMLPAISNMIEIKVISPSEMTVQSKARVGEPVKWTRKAAASEAQTAIRLEHAPISMSVRKIHDGRETEVEDVKVRSDGMTRDMNDYLEEKASAVKPDVQEQVRRSMGSFMLEEEAEENSEVELIIEDDLEPAEEITVEYYTEAPEAVEQEVSDYKKIVAIRSDIHYTDITAFTQIDEMPLESIRLYHTTGGIRESVSFEAFDRNSNGLIDYIEWTVPHLSEQTYEVEITVLNVQSYPIVGGDWEVRFTTIGKADLTMKAINETSYGTSLPHDLMPKELRCGGTVLGYEWLGSDEAYYHDYECNETGYWIVTVLTEGIHNQKFEFGDAEAYANNLASIKVGDSNLTIWDDTDSMIRYATDNTTFYANYTNGTQIANGTCTIRFNFTGSWQDEANMTYNGVWQPWNYSRTVGYKGVTYYNILCENESMATLNVTDILNINNSAPLMNLTVGKLPPLSCTEDVHCTYNLSQQVTDVDINEVLSYDYTAGSIQSLTSHADCNGCWIFDFTNGNLTVYVTTTDHANSGPFSPELTVTDSDDVSDIGTLDITVIPVNDYPVITQPAGSTMSSGETEALYQYQMAATDEEDASLSIFNFTIVWCNRSYVDNCDGVTISMNTTTGAFNFTPVNDDAGNYTLNISVTDSIGATTWKLVNLSITDINNPPVLDFVCNLTRSAMEDIHFNCTINASDPENDLLTFEANYSWFTLNRVSNTEMLANFTPLNSRVGNYTILINVTDGYYSDSTVISFMVNNTNDMPIIYNISNQIAIIGSRYSYYIQAYDEDLWQPYGIFNENSENLTLGINSSWFSLSRYNATAAYINFTAIESQEGNYTIFVNVSDMDSSVYNTTFNLTVRNNTAPWFEWICNNSRFIQEEVLHSCHVNASDLEGDSYTFSTNTSWFSINSTTGNVSFTANDTEVGNHTINFTVTDTWGSSSSSVVEFEVNNTQEAPEIGIVSLSAYEGTTFIYDMGQNITDQDSSTPAGETLWYGINHTFSGRLALNHTTGVINFTPHNDDVGVHEVNITVNDSTALTASKVISFTVFNVNQPPVLSYWCQNNDSAVEDTAYICQIIASDPDVGDTLTYDAVVIGASEQWFSVDSTGLVNFTPLNHHVGNHTINISVTDSINVTYELLNFTVNNTNDAPILDAIGNLNATEDTLFTYTVMAFDNDTLNPVNDTIIFASNSTLFSINSSTGAISFTPNSSQVGNYTIRFNVTDLAGEYDEEIVNFTIFDFNDAPVIDTIPNFVVDENDAFYYDVNASDEEDDDSLIRYRTNASAEMFVINDTTGIISFSPNSTFIGMHSINLTVNDTTGKEASQLFNFTVRQLNFLPNITMIMPYGTPVSSATVYSFASRALFPDNITSIALSENSSVIFNHTSVDLNGDALNSSWYKDGTLVYSSTDTVYSYSLGFYEAGQHNLTLIVEDGRDANDTFRWNITVDNVNRPPLFGVAEHNSQSDFSGGVENSTNSTAEGIILAVNGSGYSMYGEFISPSIDIGPLVTSFYNPIGFTSISWGALTPDGTNVTVQTRTSDNNIDWNNWSIMIINRSYISSAGEQIVSENTTYIQYKAIMQTNDSSISPNVTSVKIEYIIPDLTIEQDSTIPNWIDLDDYFHDLDTDDALTFNVHGASYTTISINNITHIASITAPGDWYGTETVYFSVNDSHDTSFSNNITITITQTATTAAVTYVYITDTTTIMRTRTRTVTEPRYLEILSPKHITAYSDDTVVAPIVLSNNGESILHDITLNADVDREEVDIWFSRDSFDTLVPGQTVKSDLYIRWKGTIDEFDIIVNATSRDPAYGDSAIISLTGVARVASEKNVEEQHIEFVRDLLNNNPECLELTELLFEAQRAFEAGDSIKTRNTLNFVIEGCRYLVTAHKEPEMPVPLKQREGDFYKLIAGILLMLLVIAVIIILALMNKERRLG